MIIWNIFIYQWKTNSPIRYNITRYIIFTKLIIIRSIHFLVLSTYDNNMHSKINANKTIDEKYTRQNEI